MIANPSESPVSQIELHILMQVARAPQHGYALMKHIAAASEGWIRPGAGTLYVALRRLLAAERIAETTPSPTLASGRSRRCYRITPSGRRTMIRELRRLAALVRGAANDGWIAERIKSARSAQ